MTARKRETALAVGIFVVYILALAGLCAASLYEHRFMREVVLASGYRRWLLPTCYLALLAAYSALVFSRVTLPRRLFWILVGIAAVLTLVSWPLNSVDPAAYLIGARNWQQYGVNPMRFPYNATTNPWLFVIKDITWAWLPSPYGPVFFLLLWPLGAIHNLTVALYVLKLLLGLVFWGMVLVWRRLAGVGPTDTRRWSLLLLNPAVLIFMLLDAHNETMMILLLLLGLLLLVRERFWPAVGVWTAAVLLKIPSIVIWPALWFSPRGLRWRGLIGGSLVGLIGFVGVNAWLGHTPTSLILSSLGMVAFDCIYICSPIRSASLAVHFPPLMLAGLLWYLVVYRYLARTYNPLKYTVWSFSILFLVATTWLTGWYLLTPIVVALTIPERRYEWLAWALTLQAFVITLAIYVH